MREHRRGRLPAIAATVLLSGCAGANSDGPIARPLLVDYPPAFQARAAEELKTLAPPCPLYLAPDHLCGCSALARMIEDYGELRAKVPVR